MLGRAERDIASNLFLDTMLQGFVPDNFGVRFTQSCEWDGRVITVIESSVVGEKVTENNSIAPAAKLFAVRR